MKKKKPIPQTVRIPIGTAVRITKAPLNYVSNGENCKVVGYLDNGYIVRGAFPVPFSGVVPCSEVKEIDVFADEVEAV